MCLVYVHRKRELGVHCSAWECVIHRHTEPPTSECLYQTAAVHL